MITYEELFQKLKKKEFSPLYLLMGEEPFFIDQISDFLEENVMDEADRDFNQLILYANDKEVDAGQVIAAAKEYPFGVPYRLVMVKEAKNLKNIELLKEYAENPSPSTILVVCYKYAKLKAAQYKPFEKNGVLFVSDHIKDNKLPAWVQNQAKTHHFSIHPNAASMITEHIGNDLSRINNEFEKLKLFLPPQSEITPDIIEKHIGISKEYNIFELQNALGERNVTKSNKIALNLALNIKENPVVKITAVLYPFFFKMLAYHLASDQSKETLTKIYGNLHPYVQQINVSYANRYSVAELRRIISTLREYDMKAKGEDSSASEEALLQELVYKIIA
jgi:DNA polymerase-3 subunit delta